MKNTSIVRKIMKEFGKYQVWTNKYDKCRTVKCYRYKMLGLEGITRDLDMVDRIAEEFDMPYDGIDYKSEFQIKITENAIIVRLPITY